MKVVILRAGEMMAEKLPDLRPGPGRVLADPEGHIKVLVRPDLSLGLLGRRVIGRIDVRVDPVVGISAGERLTDRALAADAVEEASIGCVIDRPLCRWCDVKGREVRPDRNVTRRMGVVVPKLSGQAVLLKTVEEPARFVGAASVD
ncbi:MAG: hypothetical protein P8P85_07590 [Acidimicrobiales bacterium]|nr:hypothetical protein [Acidimicrobiales bacterium]